MGKRKEKGFTHQCGVQSGSGQQRSAEEEESMESMRQKTKYFVFLDGLRNKGEVSTIMAPVELMKEFPDLRAEEAKAICAEWRATYHERHSRPTRSTSHTGA